MNVFSGAGLTANIGSNPLLAIAIAATVGLLTSIGPCTFLRAATLFGLVGERPQGRQGLGVAAWFVEGLIVAYVALGMLLTFVSGFKSAARVVYPVAGVLLVLLGLNMARVLKLPSWRGPQWVYALRSRLTEQRVSGLNAFVLGGTFAFMVCPCCLPVLLTVYAFTFASGQFVYGIALVTAFTVAHSLPLLLVGYFGHLAKRLAKARRFEESLNFLLGVIVFVTGVVVLWIV